jgi:hypothetical protein
VLSAYLYAGTGATLTINNGIDLLGKGGLVWIKGRNGTSSGQNHALFDTARGIPSAISSNTTAAAQTAYTDQLTSFNANGFSLGADSFTAGEVNAASTNYVSWSFRKQPKFFDVVTYTGTGANRTIAHSLGSVPGMIIVKRTDAIAAWQVYHRSLTTAQYMVLNTTAQVASSTLRWNNTAPTSTVFSIGTDATVNASGGTYVAYLFAHDAGGFGLTGTDNVISCGSFTSGASGEVTVNLGYEPQLVLLKRSSSSGTNWTIVDSMRGFPATTNSQYPLFPNTATAESLNSTNAILPTSTGFIGDATYLGASNTYIYMAIRRGPMKVPTSGTSVFGLNARTGTGANATVTGGQTDDTVLIKNRGSAVASLLSSRLTGTGYVVTSSTAVEVAAGTTILQANPWDVMDGVKVGTTSTITNASANTFINYLFRRAPGFFDVVCYTGTGTYPFTINHNLGVAPELMIFKRRDVVDSWWTMAAPVTSPRAAWYQNYFELNATIAVRGDATSITTAPTSTAVTIAAYYGDVSTWSLYLFATLAGVSKVGSYTGNGTTQTIDCGFGAGGARFVLIKRTDAVGDWYVYDTARGMTTLTDPYWLTNSTAAEVATLGSVTTVSTGFALNSAILAAINVNASKYIFLAIA